MKYFIVCQRCGIKFNSGRPTAKWCYDCKEIVISEQHRKLDVEIDYEQIRREVKHNAI
jgi:hypothetical protein